MAKLCNFDNVFILVDEEREDLSTTVSGPSSAASETPLWRFAMAFRWRADDGPTLNAGLVATIFQGIGTCISRKPFIFVIFRGRGRDPPLDPHMYM